MASITQPAKLSEEALARYITAVCGRDLADLSAHKRFDEDELGANRYSIQCRRAARELPDAEVSGAFVCDMAIVLTTNAGDKQGREHDEYAGTLYDACMRPSDDVVAELNAAMKGESFTAFFWYPPEEIAFDVSGHKQRSEMIGRLHMVPLASA